MIEKQVQIWCRCKNIALSYVALRRCTRHRYCLVIARSFIPKGSRCDMSVSKWVVGISEAESLSFCIAFVIKVGG